MEFILIMVLLLILATFTVVTTILMLKSDTYRPVILGVLLGVSLAIKIEKK